MRARRHVPSTTDATGDGLLREVAPTMAFATAFYEVETMAHVELDYSINQERAIFFQGRFF